jgi:hypothetical protein
MRNLYHFILPTLDSNDAGFSEEDNCSDIPEGNQGQANQGKPSILGAYLNPNFILMHVL